ncbi:MAG TPA: 4Fe-4S dicluster domain-containing protein [Anaerolineae bacterium]|nr:4Fe-4S dicluster domain-containing protein [Anaerolineae bacterium]
MIEAMIDVQKSAGNTIQGLLRSLLEQGVVDAWLVPMALPGGAVAPSLVSEAAALERADPLAPVLPINAARAVSQLTMTGHKEKLGVVLRACEIRAVVELVKFQQASLEGVLVVGIDCLGTYSVSDRQAAGDKDGLLAALLVGAVTGEAEPGEGPALREACQMCEQPLPEGEEVALTVGLVGIEPGRLYLKARADVAEALGLAGGGAPAGRKAAVERLLGARRRARDEALAGFRERVNSMEGLLSEFSACVRCHNCMVNCPICYCRECIFRTPTFEHESQLYYQWAERKGTVRMMPDTLLFHLTRLNHMATSCVGCGVCTEACPVDIPVGTVFRAVGEKVQALFDYHPGRSLAEAAPVQEFREDELTALGERGHA